VTAILDLAKAALEDDEKATPGPWRIESVWTSEHSGADAVFGATTQLVCTCDEHDGGYGGGQRNVEFIAAARTREPQLAREVIRLMEECERLVEACGGEAEQVISLAAKLAEMTAARDRLAHIARRAIGSGAKRGILNEGAHAQVDSLVAIGRGQAVAVDQGCQRTPFGWYCTREPGHEGPCAAVPKELDELGRAKERIDELCYTHNQLLEEHVKTKVKLAESQAVRDSDRRFWEANAEGMAAKLASATAEADRLRHGVGIEGDFVCPRDLERDELKKQLAAVSVEVSYLKDQSWRLQWAHAVTERDALAAKLAEVSAARDELAAIAKQLVDFVDNHLCRRCSDSVRTASVEDIDRLRAVGKAKP
jgi:hypothetical protein